MPSDPMTGPTRDALREAARLARQVRDDRGWVFLSQNTMRAIDEALAIPDHAPDVEAAFIEAVNAPSKTGRGIAVPHYRDVEAIWRAIEAAIRAQGGGLETRHSLVEAAEAHARLRDTPSPQKENK